MSSVNEFLYQLSDFSRLLQNQDFQGLLRLVSAITTLLFSSITFYRRLKENREGARAQFAVAEISRDSRTGLPIKPLWMKKTYAPFPIISANLKTRAIGSNGWHTITSLRVWNAGKEPLWGSEFNPTAKVHIEIKKEVGAYTLLACLSNDVSARVHIGRVIHTSSGQQRLPIYFDILRPNKGILVEICHNAADGSEISVSAISDQSPRCVDGIPHILKPKLVKWTNLSALWLVLPSAILTFHLTFSHDTTAAIQSGVFTWILISLLYLQWKLKPLAPEDLGFNNKEAKIIFNHYRR